MVASGLGITVLPRSSVANRPDDSTQIISRPFVPQAPSRRIALIWRRTFPRFRAISALRDCILDGGLQGVSFLPQAQPSEVQGLAV